METVGAGDLGHHADGMGNSSTLGMTGSRARSAGGTVAVLTAVGGPSRRASPRSRRGSYEVVHVPLLRSPLPDGIQLLGGGKGVQGTDAEHLGLTRG